MSLLAIIARKYLGTLTSPIKIANSLPLDTYVRRYAKKCGGDKCRRANVDIPPEKDPVCPETCDRWKPKKENILHKIKLKIIEGGTNFGTPFRRVQCSTPDPEAKSRPQKKIKRIQKPSKPDKKPKKSTSSKTLVPISTPEPRPGIQVSILGVDTAIGQYLALLLKQCPTIRMLRLYEAKDHDCCDNRNICNIVQDLQHIDTNCNVQAFSCSCCELERCLQSTDIVVMLENGKLNMDMSVEERFKLQAPIVKTYADAISTECPTAFVIVCATPIDCMVPLIAETLKETGWYDPRKLFGSMAVPEMRASTLAARALCLEPRYTRVPCVGGTEGESLVPLFSKAVEYFDFAKNNAVMMTEAVRMAPIAISRSEGARAADLSEAHALARLVTSVSHALLCNDVPRVTGFVETDSSQVISPARFIANLVEINRNGIVKNFGLPKLTEYETHSIDLALIHLQKKMCMVEDWYCKYLSSSTRLDTYKTHFFMPRTYQHIDDCAYSNT